MEVAFCVRSTEKKEIFKLLNALAKCKFANKIEVFPECKLPREKLTEAIKDCSPEDIKKIYEYIEFLHYKQTHK